MEILFSFSKLLGFYSLAVILIMLLIVFISSKLDESAFDMKQPADLKTRILSGVLQVAAMGLACAILGFIAAGIWWLWLFFIDGLTPGTLALYSVIIGPSPLALTLFAIVVAKLLGGDVNAAQVKNCTLWGVDLGGIIYNLFMSYYLAIFTGGLAFMGLLASAIWALVD